MTDKIQYDLFGGLIESNPGLNIVKEKTREILEVPISAGLNITSWLKKSINDVTNPLSNFKFAMKEGRIPFDEFEKNFMPKVPNILQGANPIGFNDVISVLETLLDDLGEDEQKEYNSVRLQISNILKDIDFYTSKTDIVEYLTANYPEFDIRMIVAFVKDWRIPASNYDSSLRDQLIDLRTAITMFIDNMTNVIFEVNHVAQGILNDEIETVGDFRDRIDSILAQFSSELETMVERLLNLLEFKEVKKIHRYRLVNVERSLRNPLFRFVKSDYIRTQTSSTSVLATSFARKEVNPRDQIDAAQAALPPARLAKPVDGVGDVVQEEKQADTTPPNGTVGPLDENDFKKLIDWLGMKESSNNYKAVNQIGYCGKYQWGAPGLIDMGFVKAGSSTRGLAADQCWTGRESISKRDDFLGSRDVQDKLIVRWMKYNYKRLISANAITKEDSKAHVAGMLAVCHLLGPGGARDYKNGRSKTDANGTSAETYYKGGSGALGGATTPTPEEAQKNREFVEANTIDDSASINVPEQTAAPVYPYNKTVTSESGHFDEVDDTPGSERIQRRHRKGTGYEYKEDGDAVYFSAKDSYDAVLGNKFIIVSGKCNIYVKGDAGIVADGNMNLNAGQDLNMVVGGDLNISVGGNKSERVSGSNAINVQGDNAQTSGGFSRISSDGDLQIEGGSASVIAREGSANLISKTDVNLVASGNFNTTVSGTRTDLTKGSHITVSYGDMAMVASYKMTINGSDLVAHGKSSSNFSSNGQTTIGSGGTIKLSHPVEKALYSDTAGIAREGSPSPVNPSGSSTDGGGGSISSDNKDKPEKKKTQKIAEVFMASDFSKTQANSGGGDGVKASTINPETIQA